MSPLVSIKGLRVAFRGVPALHGIDLSIARGESLGLVGESGCGKSITWLAALGLLPSTAQVSGTAELSAPGSLGEGRGEGASAIDLLTAPQKTLDKIRGARIAMIFQDPASALNPVHRIGTQIAEAVTLHRGLHGAAAKAEARRLLDLVGIPGAAQRMHAYPHEMSGGQNQRVIIATALAGQPELLIADEPTTALDVTIQAGILDLLRRLQAELGMAMVLISHDLGVVAETCRRVMVMYAGRIVEEAPADDLFDHPRHPYTAGLLAALPDMQGPRRRLAAIPGSVPEPGRLPPGCAFAPRCPRADAACDAAPPALRPLAPRHRAACIHTEPARTPEYA